MLPVLESPFYFIVMLIIIAILALAFQSTFQSGEEEKTEVLGNTPVPFIKTIGNIVRVTQDPEIDVSCSQGIEQTLYTVELKEAKVKFLERSSDQDVYVSIVFKGARDVVENIQPLKSEVEQLLSSDTPGEVKFVKLLSEEPPPILKNDVAVHSGQIK